MNRFYSIILSIIFLQTGPVWSQNDTDSIPTFKDSALRNLSLVTDFGFCGYQSGSDQLKFHHYDWANSKSVNVSLYRSLHLKGENIMLKVGLGLSMDGYKFKKATTLLSDNNGTHLVTLPDSGNYRKSKLAVNYFGLPIEIQFKNNWLYPIKFAIGIKPEYLFDAHTKHKYENQDGVLIKEKNHRNDYNMNTFRLSSYMRFSISHVGIFSQYSLTPLFIKDKGPELIPLMVGINYLID